MFRNLLKNTKGQNTAEYALLIALVVAGVIAMQTYAQRSLQARMHDAAHYLTSQQIGNTAGTDQYEPPYLQSTYDVSRNAEENKRLGKDFVATDSTSNRTRASGGSQTTTYNGTGSGD